MGTAVNRASKPVEKSIMNGMEYRKEAEDRIGEKRVQRALFILLHIAMQPEHASRKPARQQPATDEPVDILRQVRVPQRHDPCSCGVASILLFQKLFSQSLRGSTGQRMMGTHGTVLVTVVVHRRDRSSLGKARTRPRPWSGEAIGEGACAVRTDHRPWVRERRPWSRDGE